MFCALQFAVPGAPFPVPAIKIALIKLFVIEGAFRFDCY